jgi:hypothetical protein
MTSALAEKADQRDKEQVARDLYDILVLYCIRRQQSYSRLLCTLLAPLLTCKQPLSRGLACACFYPLAADFAPLIGLKSTTALELGLDCLHSWLRLLVLYHSPALAQHFDRTVPGWEQSSGVIKASEVSELTIFFIRKLSRNQKQ